MKLSICILFCDKDSQYLKSILTEIGSNIKNIKYEIILFDNRQHKDADLSFDNVKIYSSNEGNIHQLAARKALINKANGDFIWFIDVDDHIPIIDFKKVDLNYNFDIFIFSEKKRRVENGEIFNNLDSCIIYALWNSIISTEILKKVSNLYIDDTDRISYKEDIFILRLCTKYAKAIKYQNIVIYEYNDNSTALKLDFSDNYDLFKSLTFGIDSILSKSESILNSDLGIISNIFDIFIYTLDYDTKLKIIKSIDIDKYRDNILKLWDNFYTYKKFIDVNHYATCKKALEVVIGKEIPKKKAVKIEIINNKVVKSDIILNPVFINN